MDSKTDHLAVAEEVDIDEAIPIDHKKEQNTKANTNRLDIDIEKMSTFEIINKVNTVKLRSIYEVIYEAYFISSEAFSDDFMQQCKDNANVAQFIPLEMKNNIKRMEI